jgi:ABC-type tungstate transport system permease subunit
MNDNNINDGGYYAIKGFAYQVDKAILEILSADDENADVNIEQIQDIDLNDSIIQVKYKETAKLTSSQVNKPISQLIEEFKVDNTKNIFCMLILMI